MSQSSGKWLGKAGMEGSCLNLRYATVMPALVTVLHNCDLNAKCDQLFGVGKKKKAAINAVMRRLLGLAKALLRSKETERKCRLSRTDTSP